MCGWQWEHESGLDADGASDDALAKAAADAEERAEAVALLGPVGRAATDG